MKKLLYIIPLATLLAFTACSGKDQWKTMTREEFDESIAGVEDTSGYTKLNIVLDLSSSGYAYNSGSGTVIPVDPGQHKECEFTLVEGEWQYEDPSDVYALNECLNGTVNHYATSIAADPNLCTYHILNNGKSFYIKCIWDEDDVEAGAPYHIHQEFHYYWDSFGRITSFKIYTKKSHDLTGVVEGYTTVVCENTQFAQYRYQ